MEKPNTIHHFQAGKPWVSKADFFFDDPWEVPSKSSARLRAKTAPLIGRRRSLVSLELGPIFQISSINRPGLNGAYWDLVDFYGI
jgi:hypothetical protein